MNVVSGLSLNDVTAVANAINEGHNAQLPNIEDIAVYNLEKIVGLPVDRYTRNGPIDIASWESTGKVGESHRSGDGRTVAYSKMIPRGRERVIKTDIFTNMPREQFSDSLRAPALEETPQQESKIAQFIPGEELRRTG